MDALRGSPNRIAVARCVAQTCLPGCLAIIVADYITTCKKVNTLGMIAFFQEKTNDPFAQNIKERRQSKFSWCLEKSPPAEMLPHAIRLEMSPERELVALASLFFNSEYEKCKSGSSTSLRPLVAGEKEELDSFVGRIVGVECEPDPKNMKLRCEEYVFGHHPWFQEASQMKKFFGHPKIVLAFLNSKQYTVAPKAAPGQIVMYHIENLVRHYGIVIFVDSFGKRITVTSKWGERPLYTHRIDIIEIVYGTMAVFLNPPQSDTPSKK